MKWTKEPPKVDGYYLAFYQNRDEPETVWLDDSPWQGDDFVCFRCGDDMPYRVSDFRAWSDAPIPLPEGEVPE